MARTGNSSKFVPVNLNNSYGQNLPLSNGGTSASSGFVRSRSFSSYGGMVSLSRSSRGASSPSSSTVSRTSKLSVPRPVNLPSLRREHSGNDPTIALVGSHGSSGWNKQNGDEIADVNILRSESLKGDIRSWANRAPGPDGPGAEERLFPGGRQSAYSPPGPREEAPVTTAPIPVVKAVVFRGEDFPTLQAATTPPSPPVPPVLRSRDSQQKTRDNRRGSPQEHTISLKKESYVGDESHESSRFLDRHLQPAQPLRNQVRSAFLDHVDDGDRGNAYHRGLSPLIKLAHTSNWADDERETLSSVRTHNGGQQGDWGERNDGFQAAGNWSLDRNAEMDNRRPTPRVGHQGRNEPGISMQAVPPLKTAYAKDVEFRRGYLDGGRFESSVKVDFERPTNNNFGKNDVLKRGWSFPATDTRPNRDMRYTSPIRPDQDGYLHGRAFSREGNNVRHDGSGRDIFSSNGRPGSQHQEGLQWHDSKLGKDVFLGKQGFPGSATVSGPRSGRGIGPSFNGSDLKNQSGIDHKLEKRVSGLYDQVRTEDPFLGEGIGSRPPVFYMSQSKMKRDSLNDSGYRDLARESFEAELERVEKMLEQERQRAIEERERAIELARKEQEEQERIAREEEEMRRKLEEEAREAAYRAQKEAEEAARKLEEARRARDEEKRMAELEEERRKEAAKRKLLELEERIAKRESEKRQEDALQDNRGSTIRTTTKDASMDAQESWPRKYEAWRDPHRKSVSSTAKPDPEAEEVSYKLPVSGTGPFASILRSPHGPPHVKEENGFSTEGTKLAQTWKKESPSNGQEPRLVQKGLQKFTHLRTEFSPSDNEEQQRAPLLRNISALKSSARLSDNRASDDADERDWWARDINRSIAPYSQNSDLSEVAPYGRIRQSLPKQPRVLPPPPGNAMSRKQPFQSDENHSGGSTGGTKSDEKYPELNEGNGFVVGDDNAGANNQDALVHVSEQFDAVPSDEVVLSDAGSQFSDDSIEDGAMEAEQEPDLHSDIVSESFSDREVDEISDLTEAQESSEDGECLKPAGDQSQDCVVDCNGEAQAKVDEFVEGLPAVKRGDSVSPPDIEEQVDDRQFVQNAGSSCSIEDTAAAHSDCLIQDVPAPENEEKQEPPYIEFQDGQEAISKGEELASEKILHDQEMHPFLNQSAFLPVVSSDAAQIRHLEGLSSRQSLVQQFQQPFSFMAVPLPQSGTLSHVGASLPTLSSVHTLSNQQDLPFHMQLGLMPSLPLLPNAIQIGSIQMPLHIHPPIPQLSHLHAHQQAPVFQFGQIGPLALSQPISMTQVPPASMQMLNASGQSNSMQHTHLQPDINSAETNIKSVELGDHQKLENGGAVEVMHLPSTGHQSVRKEHTEIAQGVSGMGSFINAGKEIEAYVAKPEVETAVTDIVPQLDTRRSERLLSNNKMEAIGVEGSSQTDYNSKPNGRPSRGQRRSNPPRYRGILGRGRGRFHGRGGHHFAYHVPQLSAENRPEGGMKKFSRGRVVRRSYRRTEYRVREPSQLFDAEVSVAETFSGFSSNIEDAKEGEGSWYIKRGSGGHLSNSSDENGQLAETVPHGSERSTAKLPVNQNGGATSAKSKSRSRRYEVNNAEDAPFQTGVVRVFEQPGIETPNDKDDFIKVRSKRQLLRELRQQREKENKSKNQDGESKDLASKKQAKASAKVDGSGTGMLATNANNLRKRNSRSDGKDGMGSFPKGTVAISLATSAKRSSASSKFASSSKAVTLEYESSTVYGNEIHAMEHSTIAAWGGQQSNQEVVSLTQIQLEEAMKPFRLDVPFPESADNPDRVISAVEPIVPCSSAFSVEKTANSVKASDPVSSLLAGEKIQFGAVTSPTLMPPENCSSTQASSARPGSSVDFGSDPSRLSSHASGFVTSFLDSHLDATYSLKEDSDRKDNNYEGKAVDLEAEAAAEAAASAVVAAAISSEDLVENPSNTRASEMNVGCASRSSVANAISGQVQNPCASDNPIAVALPADLSVETPSSLFQGSSIPLSNSPGVVLQSLQGGAPTFPCLEMGSLIGGPIFNFGPREDPSILPMEPALSAWQQRHVGAPDSYYGSPPFMNPAGLSSMQGHPHMLVYTNPYTPVGQFGQLGVSFMGTTYHPSGKQPDWTYVPLPAQSSGAVTLNDGDLNAVSNGMMAPQHHAGASNLIQTQRSPITASSVMSAATPSSVFDTGFAAPFQVSPMDGLVQSHWSKAPAPPLHGVSVAGSPVPLSLLRPGVDLNVHPNVLTDHNGHFSNLMDVNDSFSQRSMKNSATGSSFSPVVDASAQFPDELGLGDSLSTSSAIQANACGPLSDANHLNSANFVEASGIRVQRGQSPLQSVQGNVNVGSEANRREVLLSSGYQEQGGLAAVDSQNKAVGRIGSSHGMGSSTTEGQSEQRASKQVGGEWNKGNQRKGATGRGPTLERGASLLPSKLKQIYVAKPSGETRKLSAACR